MANITLALLIADVIQEKPFLKTNKTKRGEKWTNKF